MKRQQRGHPSQLAGQDQAGPLGRRGPAEKDEQKGPGEGMAESVAPIGAKIQSQMCSSPSSLPSCPGFDSSLPA